ncbi:MAG: hypothetical protein Q6L60_09550 [Thermostichus sp. HHBFW_bins_43]
MWENEILEEIHKIREEHAKSFNYDLDAMFADWRKRQSEGGREVVSLPPKRSQVTRWSAGGKALGGNVENTSHPSA